VDALALVSASLPLDATRAAVVAVSVAAALGMVKFVGGWLMRSARDDFRQSVATAVRDQVRLETEAQTKDITAKVAQLRTDMEAGFAEAIEDRKRTDARLDIAMGELQENGGSSLKDSVVRHGKWLRRIMSTMGIPEAGISAGTDVDSTHE
jgi:cell division protein FtsX